MTSIKLITKDNKVYATSREIAENFNKEHKHVMESIRELQRSVESSTHLFTPSKYKDVYNREQSEYLLTEMGFTLLAMSFTGKKALQFKIGYIEKFNDMKDQLNDVNEKVSEQGHMSLADYNKIRFSVNRTKNTFANCEVGNVKSLVDEFLEHVVELDTKTRITRCKSAEKGLNELHDATARESNMAKIGDCYNINQYVSMVKDVRHETENRQRGQKIAYRNRKLNRIQSMTR